MTKQAIPLGGMCISGLQRHVPACASHRGPELETETGPSRVEQAKKSQRAPMTEYSTALRMDDLQLQSTLWMHPTILKMKIQTLQWAVGMLEDSARWGQNQARVPWQAG